MEIEFMYTKRHSKMKCLFAGYIRFT